ncbi:MAG: type II toxin-antitoxin system VapC family toxin [Chthoniobacteraceae bacterium]
MLLDTHAFIWWDNDRSKLSDRVLTALHDPQNTLHLSLVSIWELQVKIQLGKLSLRLPLAEVVQAQCEQNKFVIEAISLKDILTLSVLPPVHRDPFDRLLVSQAKRGDFHLVSHDAVMSSYPVEVFW